MEVVSGSISPGRAVNSSPVRRKCIIKGIEAITAASDCGAAARRVLTRSEFKRVFHRAWPDLQRMKRPLPVARSYRVSFFPS